jgi:hypothetical protein
MKTVGIFTFHRALNSGAVLQAYSLQSAITGLGHSCTIVDYLRRLDPDPYQFFFFPRGRRSLRHDLFALLHLRDQLRLRERFRRFLSARLVMTPISYGNPRDLRTRGPSFDACITGSDQVWNPNLLRGIHGKTFYLDAIPGRRIAYAPSFGVSDLPLDSTGTVADLLNPFDFLSAREDAGCAIIRALTGRCVDVVVDPTLLHSSDQFDTLAVEPAQEEPYLLLYAMQRSDLTADLACAIGRLLSLPILAIVPIHLRPGWFRFADRVIYDAGPAEFLGWMKHAAFVCTDSYHGLAFSLIYHKDFVSAPHLSSDVPSRSLLQQAGLLSRRLTSTDDVAATISHPIDQGPVRAWLDQARARSLHYLRNALT